MTDKLPRGWASARIADVCDVVGGGTPKTGIAANWGGDVAWITPDDLSRHEGTHIRRGRRSLTQLGYESCSASLMPEGAILFSSRAPIGRIAIASGPVCTNQGCKSFIPRNGLLSEYVYWHLRFATPEIQEMGTGTTFKEISKTTASSIKLLIPPMTEQKRIVSAIEEHFSRLDAAEATLSATGRKLDAWLTSFLTEACGGEWPKAPLSDVIRSLRNGVFVSRPSAQPPGHPIYRISAVRPLVLRTDDIRFADPVPKKADTYMVQSGDILLTRYSGNPRYVGAAAVVPPSGAGILHPDKLIRVVANRERILPEWIAAYVTVGEGRREIERRLKTTAGQVGISGSQLKTVQVAVPPLSHQQYVVARIGVMREAQDRARRQLDGIAARIEALRRSVLATAFSGRLVPQDPDDEPASVLLERIAAARPAKPARRKART